MEDYPMIVALQGWLKSSAEEALRTPVAVENLRTALGRPMRRSSISRGTSSAS
jgi:hypothetical protein